LCFCGFCGCGDGGHLFGAIGGIAATGGVILVSATKVVVVEVVEFA
jgi:hypothetical protein